MEDYRAQVATLICGSLGPLLTLELPCRIGRRVEDYRAQVATLSPNFFYSLYLTLTSHHPPDLLSGRPLERFPSVVGCVSPPYTS